MFFLEILAVSPAGLVYHCLCYGWYMSIIFKVSSDQVREVADEKEISGCVLERNGTLYMHVINTSGTCISVYRTS